jgi:hypothetical protein
LGGGGGVQVRCSSGGFCLGAAVSWAEVVVSAQEAEADRLAADLEQMIGRIAWR